MAGVKTHEISIPAGIIKDIEKELEKGQKKRPWEPWEEEVVRKYNGVLTRKQIGKILGRSAASIKSKSEYMCPK